MNKEIYFSFDIEADGPIPGPNSMLSFGCAAFDLDLDNEAHKPIATFSANLLQLEGATTDSDTMAFWAKNPTAYAATRENCRPPETAIRQFVGWVHEVSKRVYKRPVAVAYPAGYDFTWLYWYTQKFAGESPFSFACLDVKTLAFAAKKDWFGGYRDATKRAFPKAWFKDTGRHTHVALDDAIEQGIIFVNIMRELTKKGTLNEQQ